MQSQYFNNINEKILISIIGLFIILYINLASPKLPSDILLIFDNIIVKFSLLFIIVYITINNIPLSIIIAFILLIIINYLKNNKNMFKILDEQKFITPQIQEVVQPPTIQEQIMHPSIMQEQIMHPSIMQQQIIQQQQPIIQQQQPIIQQQQPIIQQQQPIIQQQQPIIQQQQQQPSLYNEIVQTPTIQPQLLNQNNNLNISNLLLLVNNITAIAQRNLKTKYNVILPLPLLINGTDNTLLGNIILNSSSFVTEASQNILNNNNTTITSILNNLPQQSIDIINDAYLKITQNLLKIETSKNNSDLIKYYEFELYKQLIKINSMIKSYYAKINATKAEIEKNNQVSEYIDTSIKENSKAESLLNSDFLLIEAIKSNDNEKTDIFINEYLKELVKVDIIIKYDNLIEQAKNFKQNGNNIKEQEILNDALKQSLKLSTLNKINQLKESALRSKNENNINLAMDFISEADKEYVKFKSLLKSEIYKNEAEIASNDGNIEDASKKIEKSKNYDKKYNTISIGQTYINQINKLLNEGKVEEAEIYKNMLQKITTKQPEFNNIGQNDNYVYVDNSNVDSDTDNLYDVVFNINKNENEENEDVEETKKEDEPKKEENNVIGYSGYDYATI